METEKGEYEKARAGLTPEQINRESLHQALNRLIAGAKNLSPEQTQEVNKRIRGIMRELGISLNE